MATFASIESNALAAAEAIELLTLRGDTVAIFQLSTALVAQSAQDGAPATPVTSFTQVLQDARPLNVAVRELTRAMEHPLESGQIVTDYKIVLPVEITMQMLVKRAYYLTTYDQLRQLYNNSTQLSVRTRTGTYDNMVITEIPHEETPDKYDAITLYLKLKQVQVVQSDSDFAPADPTQADTQNLGEQNSIPPNLADTIQLQIDIGFGGLF